jgi:hypothetical protein
MKLQEKSSALVINEDLTTEIHLAQQQDNDFVLSNSFYVVLIGVLFEKEDEDFFRLLETKRKKYLPETEET